MNTARAQWWINCFRTGSTLLVAVAVCPAVAQEGLRGEYFNNVNVTGTPIIRIDPQVNFNWQQGSPVSGVSFDRFSVRWTGQVVPLQSGVYTFVTVSDDGVRLWVNGQRLINNWTPHLPTTDTGSIFLKGGRAHTIQFEFFDLTVDALVSLSWQSASQPLEIIPQARLRVPPLGENRPPNIPIILAPAFDGLTVEAADPVLRTDAFSDPDTGNLHACSEWEIVAADRSERVWHATCGGPATLLSSRLSDGVFENSHSNRAALELHRQYILRVRHKDSSQSVDTEWSNWAERTFNTARPLSVIVPAGAVWRYQDNSADLGTTWRTTNYNDGSWLVGRAQFGFGDGDETTITCCSFGPRPITTYFRHSFVITNASLFTNLTGRLLRDDGGVVYLNGLEVFRSNLQPGIAITYNTFASSATEADEFYNFHPFNIPANRLRRGINVLAVEIHQSSSTSSDLSFDFELVGEVTTFPRPLRIERDNEGCIWLSWDESNVLLEQSPGASGPWSAVAPQAESPYRICGMQTSGFFRLRRR